MPPARLLEVAPTVFLQGPDDALRQLVRVRLAADAATGPLTLRVLGPAGAATVALGSFAPGETTADALIPAPETAGPLTFALEDAGGPGEPLTVPWQPPRRWRVHVVQTSHHDVGYTNLPSTVLREHVQFLDAALDMAAATADAPEDARFRLVIEQAWSLREFLRTAPPDRVAQMLSRLQAGDFELTALCGNLTTELCSPEMLLRALQPSFSLAQTHGFEIVTTEHNDVPGMTWGLAEALGAAGIRYFLPQLPRYWSWGQPPLPSFWDDAALFPHDGPSAFWWEAPSGRRVLLWDRAHGPGGGCRPDLPGLAEALQAFAQGSYPYHVALWSVRGGARDNSPYIPGFAETVRQWNERWTYPRLIVSTNTRFCRELEPQLPPDLPVFRGDLPGQDYPVGAASTAAATAVNRLNHARLPAAETLATLAAAVTDHEFPAADADQATEDILWHDEHTWGHHFPAGPAAEASELEKAVHAYRAAAVSHNLANRALARIADHVQLPGDGFYLVVFNPLPYPCTSPVSTPLRELENCGSVMFPIADPEHPATPPYLRGVPLTDRWHKHPAPELLRGEFDLCDVATGKTVPFQIDPLGGPEAPMPHAPQRFGLAQGGKRYGIFEVPEGLALELRFVAHDLPAGGYRTYELRPREEVAVGRPFPRDGATGRLVIESEYYRLAADTDTGRVVSLIDREADRELLDASAPHGLGELVVRSPEHLLPGQPPTATRGANGPVYQSLEFVGRAPGHPHYHLSLGLHAGVKRLEVALRVLKDPTPLLDAWLAFPFLAPGPGFQYEGPLACPRLPEDLFPGAYWDAVAVQNWLAVNAPELSVLWTSREAPIASLGGLQPGYTSPAHSCRLPERIHHAPAGPAANGWVYSLLFANNFGTNFAVSQTGSVLFRYSFTSLPAAPSPGLAARLGALAVTPPETIFATRRRPGHLPLADSHMEITGDPLTLLACTPARDGRGHILRLWNPGPTAAASHLRTVLARGGRWELTSVTEDDSRPLVAGVELGEMTGQTLSLRVAPGAIANLRLLP